MQIAVMPMQPRRAERVLTGKHAPLSGPWTPEQVKWLRRIGIVALVGVVALFLWNIRTILPLFLLGLCGAYLLNPLVDRLAKQGLPRTLAIVIVFTVLGMAALSVLLLVVPPLIDQATQFVQACLPPKGRYYLLAQQLLTTVERRALRGDVPPFIEESVRQMWEQMGKFLLGLLQGTLASLSGLFSFVLLPLIVFYALQIFDPMRNRLRWWVPAEYREALAELVREIESLVGRYVRGYMVLCLAVGVVDTLFLSVCQWVFGMDFALAIGVLGGALYAVPYFGAIITTGAGVLAAYTTAQHHPIACAVTVAVGLIGINQLFDWFIMPRLVGHRVGLHPLTVLFAVMAGGTLMGVLGMLLAVPVAGAIKLTLQALFPYHFLPDTEQEDAAKMTVTHHSEGGDKA